MPQSQAPLVADPHRQMFEMIFGYAVSQIIRAAAELHLADHLAPGPVSAQQVADREASAPGTTLRLLRACVALGLATTEGDGHFHGTPLLDTLRTDAPRSLQAFAMAVTNTSHWLPWNRFGSSVRPCG